MSCLYFFYIFLKEIGKNLVIYDPSTIKHDMTCSQSWKHCLLIFTRCWQHWVARKVHTSMQNLKSTKYQGSKQCSPYRLVPYHTKHIILVLNHHVVLYSTDTWYYLLSRTILHTNIVIGWYRYKVQYRDSEPWSKSRRHNNWGSCNYLYILKSCDDLRKKVRNFRSSIE